MEKKTRPFPLLCSSGGRILNGGIPIKLITLVVFKNSFPYTTDMSFHLVIHTRGVLKCR